MSRVGSTHFATLWEEIADLEHTLRYVDAGGYRTRMLDFTGAGPEAQTVVLASGTSGHIEAWTQNIRAFVEAGFRVVGYDYPGHGYTSLADHPLEISDYEEHLLALLDALALERVHLAGESLGGWLALKFAPKHPDRLHTVILSAPGGRMVAEPQLDRTQSVSAQAVSEPTFENVKKRLQVVIHDPEKITDELVRVRQAIYARDGFSMAYVSALREPERRWRNRVTDDDFAAVPVPALMVWTDNEPTGDQAEGERLCGLIPDGEYLLVRGASHWPQWEGAAEFNAAAVAFLKQHAGREDHR
ncbi:2-hydroxy-6-oxonona-2,4-dienedioate hydrolase [Streptomyces brevispora]|uniref:2-hydroxy-6-oxonona-2,4-dienedioate hydrolase n=1 Tax=Streptomyces brevispora TaxID=887462 RepID=A0A561V3Q1_9ACTN|nr:alpha/beta fold hydrolase [Streptomyces brevispora]TWG06232.1 2-hydroxy-6-oxonona-2,4-dienedioate hydrolase [Streptomyces brevispora]